MRVVVTGQVGLDKQPFLEQVRQITAADGHDATIFNVGEMMYAEAPDVSEGKILDLPLTRLTSLRRSIFKDILAQCAPGETGSHAIINTHATFRWRHGLFYAFDYDQMKLLDADLYIVLVDDIDRLQYRMARDGYTDHTLKDLMVWREEEMLATELLAQIVRGHGSFYIWARGHDNQSASALARLIGHPDHKRAYLSYPMSHIGPNTPTEAVTDIDSFRREMKRHFICFDPGDIEEKPLCQLALNAAEQGRRHVEFGPDGAIAHLPTEELLAIIPDIDGQIYARDFKLIDQTEMIISLVPEIDGRPALSSGVERELQHAHEATKDVFVIWRPEAEPSPFITETATKVFNSTEAAIEFFGAHDFLPPPTGALFS